MTRRGTGFRVTAVSFGLVLLAQAAPTGAGPTPHMRVLNFAMVGLAAGQVARLNVASVSPPEPDLAPGSCGVELSFVTADGSVFIGRDGQPVALTVQLAGGQSGFLDLDADALGVAAAQRVAIRGVVRASRRCAGAVDDPNLMPSLEIFDGATGRTTVFVQPGSTRFIKEVDPAPAR